MERYKTTFKLNGKVQTRVIHATAISLFYRIQNEKYTLYTVEPKGSTFKSGFIDLRIAPSSFFRETLEEERLVFWLNDFLNCGILSVIPNNESQLKGIHLWIGFQKDVSWIKNHLSEIQCPPFINLKINKTMVTITPKAS